MEVGQGPNWDCSAKGKKGKSVFVVGQQQCHSCVGGRILLKLETGQWLIPLKKTKKNRLKSNLRTYIPVTSLSSGLHNLKERN
jgi:hypothetical protein